MSRFDKGRCIKYDALHTCGHDGKCDAAGLTLHSGGRMIVQITRRARFSAAHSYQNMPENALPPLLRERARQGIPHGHNYAVDITCRGRVDERTGMVLNVTELDRLLKEVLGPLDQSFLEREHPDVAWGLPTTENLCRWVWMRCLNHLSCVSITRVRVAESDILWSEYRGEPDMAVYMSRAYEFAAAHRLHSQELSSEENSRIFGKCNNPNGHGHNYGLEVTLRGIPSERTGMICDTGWLDGIVERCVISRFDHKHLNLDVSEFASLNPTSENLAAVIWNLLRPETGEMLYAVRIRETGRNSFDYYGEE